jgi:hypothetical protein
MAYQPSNCSSPVEIKGRSCRNLCFACGDVLVPTRFPAVSMKLESKNRFVLREILIAWLRTSRKILGGGRYDNWIPAGIVMQFLLTALVKH